MIVFDLDDTLYKERDFVESGRKAVARAFGNCPGFDIDGPWTQEMLYIYRTHMPDISLSDEIFNALFQLKHNGNKIGIITDGRSITQRYKIIALGLDKIVDDADIIISDEIGAEKLSGIPYKTMMLRNPDEKSYVYIADNPSKDFVMANRLGWHTVMLADSHSLNIHSQKLPTELAYHPKETINNLTEYLNLINHIQCLK